MSLTHLNAILYLGFKCLVKKTCYNLGETAVYFIFLL